MNQQEDSILNPPDEAQAELRDTGNNAARADETGDVAEADAPVNVEENIGMSTILGSGAGTGIQTDAGDE